MQLYLLSCLLLPFLANGLRVQRSLTDGETLFSGNLFLLVQDPINEIARAWNFFYTGRGWKEYALLQLVIFTCANTSLSCFAEQHRFFESVCLPQMSQILPSMKTCILWLLVNILNRMQFFILRRQSFIKIWYFQIWNCK